MSASEPQSSNRGRRNGGGRQQAGRLWRLVLKELREILRDRRTIVTLVVMPILIYPLLAVVFQRFLVTSLSGSADEEITYVIGVDSRIERQVLERQLEAGNTLLMQRQVRQKGGEGFDATKAQMCCWKIFRTRIWNATSPTRPYILRSCIDGRRQTIQKTDCRRRWFGN